MGVFFSDRLKYLSLKEIFVTKSTKNTDHTRTVLSCLYMSVIIGFLNFYLGWFFVFCFFFLI